MNEAQLSTHTCMHTHTHAQQEQSLESCSDSHS